MSIKKLKDLEDLRERFLDGIGVPDVGDFKPDDFQLEAIQSLADGNDTLVVAPTGAGKTYIAVEAIKLMLEEQRKSIYTAPLKALSNSKYTELKKKFEPEFRVGLLTGDRKIDTDAEVVVATTEIYRNDLYSGEQNYSLVILDELHYLADPSRGAVWEESIILSSRESRLLMLSASVSNAEFLADWIYSIRGRKVNIIRVTERPVELRLGFLHPEFGLMPLHGKKGSVMPEIQRFYNSSSFKRGGRKGPRFSKGKGTGKNRKYRKRKS